MSSIQNYLPSFQILLFLNESKNVFFAPKLDSIFNILISYYLTEFGILFITPRRVL